MPYTHELMKLQFGKETTFGTPVTDTAKAMDVTEFSGPIMTEGKVLRTRRGSLLTSHNAVLVKQGAEATVSGFATYEDLPYWLETCFAVATPGAGPTYTRDYATPTTAPVTPRMQTLYYGYATEDIYKYTSMVGKTLKIAANKNEETTYECAMIGKSVASGASFAALSDRTVTPVVGDQWAMYVDAWGGTIGSTAIASTFYSWELEINTNRDLTYYLGALAPGAYKQPGWEIKLKMHLEWNSITNAYVDVFTAASALFQRQVRLKATSGTSIIQIDFAGSAESSPTIFEDEDGVASVDIELTDTYNSGMASSCEISVSNGVSALA